MFSELKKGLNKFVAKYDTQIAVVALLMAGSLIGLVPAKMWHDRSVESLERSYKYQIGQQRTQISDKLDDLTRTIQRVQWTVEHAPPEMVAKLHEKEMKLTIIAKDLERITAK